VRRHPEARGMMISGITVRVFGWGRDDIFRIFEDCNIKDLLNEIASTIPKTKKARLCDIFLNHEPIKTKNEKLYDGDFVEVVVR
jgi:hypothetical protein